LETEKSSSLSDYLAAVRRRRLLVAAVALPVFVIGSVLALALPNAFTSTATFRLVTDRIAAAGGQGESDFADQYVYALADKVLTSDGLRSILREVDPYPALHGNEAAAFERLRSGTDLEMVVQTILEPGGGRERKVNVGFTVAYKDRSPATAYKVATALSQAFVQTGRSDQLTVANGRVKFFSGEADRLSTEIDKLEKRLADFKAANFEKLPETAQANFAAKGRLEQESDGIENQLRSLQQNRVFVLQQLRQAQMGPAADNLRALEDEYARKSAVYADTHPDVVALRRQIETLKRGGAATTGSSLQAQLDAQRAALAEARLRYSDDHPDIKRMQRNIESLETRIAAGESATSGAGSQSVLSVQLETQLNGLNTQIAGLEARRNEMRAQVAKMERQLGATPEVEREYQEISRGLDNARHQYGDIVNKRLEAVVEVAAINSGSADRFKLFTPPAKPWSPSGPKRLGIFVVSVLAALLLALASVAAAESFDSRVRGARDIRAMFGVSPLVLIPEIRNSLYQQRHRRRIAALAWSVVLGAPVAYLSVYLLTH